MTTGPLTDHLMRVTPSGMPEEERPGLLTSKVGFSPAYRQLLFQDKLLQRGNFWCAPKVVLSLAT